MDYCDLTHTDRQLHKMRPRTPPMPPISRRSRSRSPPRRRYYSPSHRYDSYRSRDRYSDSYDDHIRNAAKYSRAKPQETRCIGIFGLSDRTTETDVRRIFSKYGYIENVVLIMDNKTRRSRGYCFVYFDTVKSAIRAVESSANLRIDYRHVRVDYSITSRPRSPGSYERHKDEISRHYDYSRSRSHRRPHSPSPRRHYR